MYLDSLAFCFFLQPSLILFIFSHGFLEPSDILLLPGPELLLLLGQFLFDFLNQQAVKLVLSFFLLFLSLVFIFNLLVSHFLLLHDLLFIFFLLFLFSLIVGLDLLVLQLLVLLFLILFHLFLPLLFLKLLVQLPFHFFLELLLSDFLKLLLFLK